MNNNNNNFISRVPEFVFRKEVRLKVKRLKFKKRYILLLFVKERGSFSIQICKENENLKEKQQANS